MLLISSMMNTGYQRVPKIRVQNRRKALIYEDFSGMNMEFDSLIPCSWRVGKLVKGVLFGSFDLTGSVTDHIKSVKMGGKTSIVLSFVLKRS